jgi:hypothetical protein
MSSWLPLLALTAWLYAEQLEDGLNRALTPLTGALDWLSALVFSVKRAWRLAR